MTTILLVHGSTQNASCWDRVGPRLAVAGHDTVTVELPKNAPGLKAGAFAERIAAAVDPAIKDVVVVGHSASGALLPLVAERRRLRGLVYLAAVLPSPGKSVIEQYTLDPAMLGTEWVRSGRMWSDETKWRELADEFLFHDLPPDDRGWAHSTVQPMRTDSIVREPAPAGAPAPVPSLCIAATLDRTINPLWQRRVWREATGQEVAEIHAGHCPHVSRPEEVALLIARAVAAW